MSSSDEAKPHVLFAGFAEVPGPTAVGCRLYQLICAFSDDFDVDAMTLKGRDLAHIQRLGTARMLRVPVEGKGFHERLGAYTRALSRQLSGDTYRLVYCADVFSAQVAAAFKETQGFTLLVDVHDLPSESFDRRHPVDEPGPDGKPVDKKRLRASWKEMEKQAFRGADRVITSSRHAARVLSERLDARKLHLMPLAVDLSVFAPPDGVAAPRPSIVVVGARADAHEREATLALLTRLTAGLGAEAEVVLAAQGQPDSVELDRVLEGTGLNGRVRRVDIDSPVRLAQTLNDASVVVVPSRAEAGFEPLALPHRALEAMACGSAVVLTRGPEPFRGLAIPDETVMLAPAGDPDAVVELVRFLLHDSGRRASLGAAARAVVEAHADLGERLEEFARLISEVVGVAMTPRHPEMTDFSASELEPSSVDVELPDASAELLLSSLPSSAAPAVTDEGSPLAGPTLPPAAPAGPRIADGAEPSDVLGSRPLTLGRFSSAEVLSSEGGALESGGNPWDGDTELEPEELAPPPSPRRLAEEVARLRGAADGGPKRAISPLPPTETDLLAGRRSEWVMPSTEAGAGPFRDRTASAPPSEPTQRADAKAMALVEKERRRAADGTELPTEAPPGTSSAPAWPENLGPAGRASLDVAQGPLRGALPPDPRSTQVSLHAGQATESAQLDAAHAGLADPAHADPAHADPAHDPLMPRATDPQVTQATDSGLSPSTLAALAAVPERDLDPWAPDTVFDAQPVFASKEAPSREVGSHELGGQDGRGAGAWEHDEGSGPFQRVSPGAEALGGLDEDADTSAHPVAPAGRPGELSGAMRSLLVDDGPPTPAGGTRAPKKPPRPAAKTGVQLRIDSEDSAS